MKKTFKDKASEWLLSLNNLIQSKPLIVSFFLSITGILFSFIIAFFGDLIPAPCTLAYYDTNNRKRLTILGIVIAIISIAWTFLVQVADRYSKYKFKEDQDNAIGKNYIDKCVSDKVGNVCNSKYNTLITLLCKITTNQVAPIKIISAPCTQLATITKELAACLCKLLDPTGQDFTENDLYVGIFYKFHKFGEWKLANSPFPEMGMSVNAVTQNPDSTINHVLNDKTHNGSLFINNKQQGVKEHKYVADSSDQIDDKGNLKGSILCYRILCKKDGVDYVTAVVSIATYNKRMVSSSIHKDIKTMEHNICHHILEPFEKRIKIELCLLYLSELYGESKATHSKILSNKEL